MLVCAIDSLANILGNDVIIKGVETEEQAKLLGQLGCNDLQGYLFGRPVSVEEFNG